MNKKQRGIVALFVCIILVAVGGYALFSIPLGEAIYPAPSASLLEKFQEELDADQIMVSADTVIACHYGGNAMIGEGRYLGEWEAFTLQMEAKEVPGEPGCVVVPTRAGDHAVLKQAGDQRVRVVLGWPLEGTDSGLLKGEMESGAGRHPLYRKP